MLRNSKIVWVLVALFEFWLVNTTQSQTIIPPTVGGGGPSISVVSFGAKCNGSTDDTVAFQAAMDSLTGGGYISVPVGTCKLTAPLQWKYDNIKMCGANVRATTLSFSNTTQSAFLNPDQSTITRMREELCDLTILMGSNAASIIDATSVQSSKFSRLEINGNNNTGSVGIKLLTVYGVTQSTYNTIDDVYIQNVATGISFGDGANMNIVRGGRMQLGATGARGIQFNATQANRINANLIDGTSFEWTGNTMTGINIQNGNVVGTRIFGIRCEQLLSCVTMQSGSNDVSITDMHATSSTNGIFVGTGSSRITLNGATFLGNTTNINDVDRIVGGVDGGVLQANLYSLSKLAAAPSVAPGANKCSLFVVAGTNAGSGKIQAQCGTSTTAVTVLDNIGSGF